MAACPAWQISCSGDAARAVRRLEVPTPSAAAARAHVARRGAPVRRQHPQQACRATPPGSAPPPPESFMDVMANIFTSLGAMQRPEARPTGAHLWASALSYHPPGSPAPLLTDVSLHLPPNRLGLIFGRSGSGKTTLLQLLAGLTEQTGGEVSFAGALTPGQAGLGAQARMARAGLVFQFPERHFVGATLAEELTAGWPLADTPQALAARQALTARAMHVLAAVGLDSVGVDAPLAQLSGGYKRRVALAVQLVRRPALLLLDEPLAGLDWRARGELVGVLAALKEECTVLVVSHDLRELAPLADVSWRMKPGGVLAPEALPATA